jgi:hypothetical protein
LVWYLVFILYGNLDRWLSVCRWGPSWDMPSSHSFPSCQVIVWKAIFINNKSAYLMDYHLTLISTWLVCRIFTVLVVHYWNSYCIAWLLLSWQQHNWPGISTSSLGCEIGKAVAVVLWSATLCSALNFQLLSDFPITIDDYNESLKLFVICTTHFWFVTLHPYLVSQNHIKWCSVPTTFLLTSLPLKKGTRYNDLTHFSVLNSTCRSSFSR